MQPLDVRESASARRGRDIELPVSPLRFLVDAFVNTFGITQPTPEAEARAGRYIAVMLAAVVLLVVAVAWLLRAAFSSLGAASALATAISAVDEIAGMRLSDGVSLRSAARNPGTPPGDSGFQAESSPCSVARKGSFP